MDSRWPARRLEYAAQIIVNALKEKKENKFSHGGMSRQEVRDAARLHIGDTGLLDYVLKSMNNVIVGSYIVCRAVNPSTRVLEYTIHELGNRVLINEPEPEIVLEPLPVPALVPGADNKQYYFLGDIKGIFLVNNNVISRSFSMERWYANSNPNGFTTPTVPMHQQGE